MGWIDTVVIVIIVLLGLAVMYKALKEPIDAVGRLIKRGIEGIKSKSSENLPGGYETIQYGL